MKRLLLPCIVSLACACGVLPTGTAPAPAVPAGIASANPPQSTEPNTTLPTPGTDPNTPAPVANCNTKLFPVCDGFETAAAGQPPNPNLWNLNVGPPPDDAVTPSASPNDNFIKISTKYAHRGSASLQVHAAAGAEHVVMQDVAGVGVPSKFLPAPNNTFYVRYWFYFDGFAVEPSGGHLYMVNASGPLNGKQQYQKFGGNESNNVMSYSWIYFGPDSGIFTSLPWPTKTWTCFETEFKGDTSELHVWVNDTEVPQLLSPAGNWAAPAFNRLTMGFEIDHPSSSYTGVDVYIDDLAYSYTRIGCAN